MPPRRPPRERAPPPVKFKRKDFPAAILPDPTPDVPGTERSPAREVYELPEFRQAIWRLLGKRELAVMLRVTRQGLYDVAKELYKDLRYGFVRSKMIIGTERGRTYCSAVNTVSASFRDLPAPMRQQLEVAADKQNLPHPSLGAYNPEICQYFIEQLRKKKCTGLRRIIYEREESAELVSWVLFLNPPSDDPIPEAGDSGRIEVYDELVGDLYQIPTTSISTPSAPSPAYSIVKRFDLVLQNPSSVSQPSPEMLYRWLQAIRDRHIYFYIYRSINLCGLPIALPDIITLCRRQISHPLAAKLSTIIAPSSLSGDMCDFMTLATIASPALTALVLADRYPEAGPDMSFHDLPNIVSIITNYLPNLTSLNIALRDVNNAEDVCNDLLSPDCLDKSGKITSLILFTAPYTNPLFNTIRYLAPLCVRYIAPSVTGESSRLEPQYWEDHIAWLRILKYLRSRPAVSRAYLATIDFPAALGVDTLAKVQLLKYGKDGRPERIDKTEQS